MCSSASFWAFSGWSWATARTSSKCSAVAVSGSSATPRGAHSCWTDSSWSRISALANRGDCADTASSIWKRLSADARTSGVLARTNARASSWSRSKSCGSARSHARRMVVAAIAECSSPMSRISEMDVERNQSRIASVWVWGCLTTKDPPLRPLRVSTIPRSRSSPKASRRVAPPTPNMSDSAASGGKRSPTLISPSAMAVEILSTIASARSISGRDLYICDSNGVGEAKSLRSEHGLRVGANTTVREYLKGFDLLQSLWIFPSPSVLPQPRTNP